MLDLGRRNVLLVALLVGGCGTKKVTPPPEKSIELAGKKAVWRDWTRIDICGVDPRRLNSELQAFNMLLAEFLGATSAGLEGVWADEQIAALEKAPQELPPALGATDAMGKATPKCRFDLKTGIPEELRKFGELSRQAQNRIAEAPPLLLHLNAKKAIGKWRADLPQAQETSKSQWCPAKPKAGKADLYFAFEDDKGATEWHFCDGAKVVAVPGGKPELVPPEGSTKKPQPKRYLEDAAKYPASEVQRSPKLPPRKVPEPPKPAEEPKDELG